MVCIVTKQSSLTCRHMQDQECRQQRRQEYTMCVSLEVRRQPKAVQWVRKSKQFQWWNVVPN